MGTHIAIKNILYCSEAGSYLYRIVSVVLFFPRFFLFLMVLLSYFPYAQVLGFLQRLGWVDSKVSMRTFRSVCRAILAILDIDVLTDCTPELEREFLKGVVLLSNHVSYLDIVILGANFPCVFLSKSEVERWPIIGSVARSIGCIFVSRTDLSSRVRAIKSIASKLMRSQSVALFPEGTTTPSGSPSLQRWNFGQLQAAIDQGKSVVACAISYEKRESAAWFGEQSLVPHIVKQFFVGPRKVFVGSELVSLEFTNDPREMGKGVHQRICRMCSAHSNALETTHMELEYVTFTR